MAERFKALVSKTRDPPKGGPQVRILPLPPQIGKNMCYLCLKDDPFAVKPLTTVDRIKQRALEIKFLLREAEEHDKCHIGDATIERLKQEQYELARQL